MSAPTENNAAAAPAPEQPQEQAAAPAAPASAETAETAGAGTLSKEDAAAQTKRQVEFYLSDSNLPGDNFLRTLYKNNGDAVPLQTLSTFKRMKPMKAVLSVEEMAQALADSDKVDVETETLLVRRKATLGQIPENPVPEDFKASDEFKRSVYIKGFPAPAGPEEQEQPELQQKIEQWANQFGTINSVRLRRINSSGRVNRRFKGSIFIEFSTQEEADAFLAKDATTLPRFQDDLELYTESKIGYCDRKMREKGIDPSTQVFGGRRTDRNRDNGNKSGAPAARNVEFDFLGAKVIASPEGKVDADTVKIPENAVVHYTGAGPGGDWREVKDTVNALVPTVFVKIPEGATEGTVGFTTTLTDDQFQSIKDKKIQVGGQEISWERIPDDQAKDFFLERANLIGSKLVQNRTNSRGGRGGGRGGSRGGGRGRGGRGGFRGGRDGRDKRKAEDDGNRAPKVAKTSE